MSFELPSGTRGTRSRPAWSGMAVVVEGMLLLVFLIGSLAVIMQLFAAASVRAQEGRQLAQAVAMATSTAERFAADPTSVPQVDQRDGLTVICKVDPQKTGDGTLFVADISIYDSADEHAPEAIYAITTASYQGVE